MTTQASSDLATRGRATRIRFVGTEGDDLLMIHEGSGDMIVTARGGNDQIQAASGSDQLMGQDGDDTIRANGGNDLIYGGDGVDTLWGGDGDDLIFGGLRNDLCFGEDGNDQISGGEGDDVISGGGGDDLLFGEDGDDLIEAGRGNDILVGGPGDDRMDGGPGEDVFLLARGDGRDAIWAPYVWKSEELVRNDLVQFVDVGSLELDAVAMNTSSSGRNYVTLRYGDDDQLSIERRTYEQRFPIHRFLFADGVELTLEQLQALYASQNIAQEPSLTTHRSITDFREDAGLATTVEEIPVASAAVGMGDLQGVVIDEHVLDRMSTPCIGRRTFTFS